MSKSSKNKLGIRLRAARTEAGFSVTDAAAALGLSKSYVSRVETGANETSPSNETLRKMAALYKVAPFDLYTAANRIGSRVTRKLQHSAALQEALHVAWRVPGPELARAIDAAHQRWMKKSEEALDG